jgi:hypothetical protein
MKLVKPTHFSLIIIATGIFLLYLYLFTEGSPKFSNSPPPAFEAMIWTKYMFDKVLGLIYYLVFCIVVLAHAICSSDTLP